MRPLVSKVLQLCAASVGVREIGISNTGKEVNAWLKSVGVPPGNPYCAAFIYAKMQQAADELDCINPYVRTGYTPTVLNWADEHDVLRPVGALPQVGDTFLVMGVVNGVYRAHHTGIVESVMNSQFRSIEGNTNTTGSANGNGVYRLTRPLTKRYRYVGWQTLASDVTPYPVQVYALLSTTGQKLCDMTVRDGLSWVPVKAWAAALGFKMGWNAELQAVTMNGDVVGGEMDANGCLPLRDLATAAGLAFRLYAARSAVQLVRP